MKEIQLPSGPARLYSPECPALAVYLPLSAEESEAVWSALPAPRPTLIALTGVDWDGALSPWPARRAFRGGNDFAGGGAAFLDRLIASIPAAEAALPCRPNRRGIAGYSLAGLFALYAAASCDAFDCAASMSGSLWYDHFEDFLASHPPRLRFAYLSLGDREMRARDPRLAAVGEKTERAVALLRKQGIPVRFETNPGGHFQDVPGRIARGLAALAACSVSADTQ